MSVGFIGIGRMGLPMAMRVQAAGIPLTVWNRTPWKCAPLAARGAVVATSLDDLFARCEVVMVMLLDQPAVDAVLERGSAAFATRMKGRTLVMLGTTSAAFSHELEMEVRAAGGCYVEAPVSGSRGPAEEGTLIGMLAGDPDAVGGIESLLAPLCRQVVRCGAVPNALRLKLAVNHYLIVLVAALAEAAFAAEASGVDMALFRSVLDAGPMASAVSRSKLDKLIEGNFSAQAAIRDVAQIAGLVCGQVHAAGAATPLIDASALLFRNAIDRGLAELDMIAVRQPSRLQGVLSA